MLLGRERQRGKKTKITIPENLDKNENPKKDIDLIYTGSRKRQDLLSKLRAWGPWEKVEGERQGGEQRKI